MNHIFLTFALLQIVPYHTVENHRQSTQNIRLVHPVCSKSIISCFLMISSVWEIIPFTGTCFPLAGRISRLNNIKPIQPVQPTSIHVCQQMSSNLIRQST